MLRQYSLSALRWITAEKRLYHGAHANLCNACVLWLCGDEQGCRGHVFSLQHARRRHSLFSSSCTDGKFGFHSTRTNGANLDAMWTQLAIERLRESHLREFGSAIDCFAREPRNASH